MNIAERMRPVLPLALVFLLAAAFASVQVADYDTWWHLALGREAAAGRLPATNLLSHTFPDYPAPDPEWLFDLLLFLSWKAGGAMGVELLMVLAVAGAFALAFAAFHRRRGGLTAWGWAAVIPLTMLLLTASRFRFLPRPQVASYLGIALLLWLWERKPRLLPLWTALAGALWANLHPGVVFGLLLSLVFPLAAMMEGRREQARAGLYAALAFLAGSLANPGLLQPYFNIIFNVRELVVSRVVAVEELASPVLARHPAFFLCALLAAAAIPWRARRRDWGFVMAASAFLILSFSAMRFIPKFALVALPGLLLTACEVAPRPPLRPWVRRLSWGVPALLMAAAVLLLARDLVERRNYARPGWGVNRAVLPEKAADLVRDRDLPGRMYNDFASGGYLAWRLYPRQLIFQDSRIYPYPSSFFTRLHHAMRREAWPALMDETGVDYAVVLRRPYGAQVDEGILFASMGWPMVHLDGISYVFVRPGSGAEARTADLAFAAIGARAGPDELFRAGRERPGLMREELARISVSSLLQAEDFARFGFAAYGAGDLVRAEGIFRAGLARHPGMAQMRANLAAVLLAAGKRKEAGAELRSIAREARGSPLEQLAREQLRKGGL
jgi:hypothetical protein